MNNLREGYVAIVKAVAEYGEKVAPRGQMTREFQCATLIVENPLDTLPVGVGRALVPGIAAVESAQLLAGDSRPSLVRAIGPQMGNYVEDDGEFWGAYGVRTRGQFDMIIRRLTDDPLSRQTVVTLWRPDLDGLDRKKDYPCTVMYSFMIRGGRLHMETVMRSNDVILGLGYDAFQHSRVQIAVASVLGAGLGEYRHHAMSLHLYERDLPKVEQLTMPQKKPDFFPAITGSSWDEIKVKARRALDAAEHPEWASLGGDRSHEWYVTSMRDAIEKNAAKEKSL
jgi:thymidylate synthase